MLGFNALVSPLALALVVIPAAVDALTLPRWITGVRSNGLPRIDPAIHAANLARRPTSTSSAIKFQYTPPTHKPYTLVSSARYLGSHSGPYDFPPEDVSYDKYTTLSYSLAETWPDPANLTVVKGGVDDEVLRKVVEYAHGVGTYVTIALGGWGGSEYFSSAVGSTSNRTNFVNAINEIVDEYELDGVDFDWEFLGTPGIGCNQVSINDTANFLQLLKDLRASDLAENATVSATASGLPFVGNDSLPLVDVSMFAKYLTTINLLTYDTYGPWSPTTGPNAPLNDTCLSPSTTTTDPSTPVVPSPDTPLSIDASVKAWLAAGFPADQITLGLPGYAHSYSVPASSAFAHIPVKPTSKNAPTFKLSKELNGSFVEFNQSWSAIPQGDVWDVPTGVDVCGAEEVQGGIFEFWGLITEGFLRENGSAAEGISYYWDNCTMTPTVYDAKTEVWIEYDDADSFLAKGKYIASTGLRGFTLSDSGSDYADILLDAVRLGAGFEPIECDTNPFTTSRIYPSSTSYKTTSTRVEGPEKTTLKGGKVSTVKTTPSPTPTFTTIHHGY